MQVHLGRIEALRVEITGVAGRRRLVRLRRLGGRGRRDGASPRRAARRASDDDDPFRVLVDALPVAVAYAAPDGTLEFANRRWQELTAHRHRRRRSRPRSPTPRDEAAVADALRAGVRVVRRRRA